MATRFWRRPRAKTVGYPSILWFRVRELSGVETRTVVSPDGPVWDDCDQTVNYSAPASSDIPVDMAARHALDHPR